MKINWSSELFIFDLNHENLFVFDKVIIIKLKKKKHFVEWKVLWNTILEKYAEGKKLVREASIKKEK